MLLILFHKQVVSYIPLSAGSPVVSCKAGLLPAKIFVLLIGVLCMVRVQAADSLQYDQLHFTSANGLPQNSIKSIAVGPKGFIWMATENGLVRFDGHRFSTFKKGMNGIRADRFFYMLPAFPSGELYGITEHYQPVLISDGKVTSSPYSYDQLFRLPRVHHRKIWPYYSAGFPFMFRCLEGGYDAHFLPGRNEKAFLVSGDSVYFLQQARQTGVRRFAYTNILHFFTAASSLYYWEGGTRFAHIAADSVFSFELSGDLTRDFPDKTSRAQARLYWNVCSGQQFIYLGRKLYLMVQQPDKRFTTQLILPDFDFESNSIRSVYYDTSYGHIFLGSVTKGLFYLKRKQFTVLKKDKSDNNYYGIVPYGSDGILTSKGRLLYLSGATETLPLLEKYGNNASILKDAQGCIWVARGKLVSRFSPDARKIIKQWTLPDNVIQFYSGKDGRIYMGTLSQGIFYLNAMTDTGQPLLFSNLATITFMLQQDNWLWVGTGRGLYAVHTKTRRCDTVRGLEQSYIRFLHADNNGDVWATTYEEGFFLLRHGRLTHFPFDADRYIASAHCILEDDKGYCWIATNNGLFQAAKSDLLAYAEGKQQEVYYHYYGTSDGLSMNEFNGGSQLCDIVLPNGHFAFSTLDGVVVMNPACFKTLFPTQTLTIDRVELNDSLLTYSDTLYLPKRFSLLKLHISTPYLGNPYNLRIEYTINSGKGDSSNWLRLNNDYTIVQSGLSSGTYHLLIRKATGFGKNNYVCRSVVLVVPLAFHETVWFFFLVLVLILLLAWLYSYVRLRFIRRTNKTLAWRIEERTGELRHIVGSLEASEKELQQQLAIQKRLIAVITHDIKTPLHYLRLTARSVYDDIKAKKSYALLEDKAAVLYSSADKVFHLTGNLLLYIKANMANSSVTTESFNVLALVEEKTALFRPIAQAKGIRVIQQVPEHIIIKSNKEYIAIILHNLLDNAVKHTDAGEVTVTAEETPGILLLKVHDTGMGMDASVVQWCNQSYEESVAAPAVKLGIGLMMVKELLSLLNGRLHAARDENGGTVMTISLPLQPV